MLSAIRCGKGSNSVLRALGLTALCFLPEGAGASWFRPLGVLPGAYPPEVRPTAISADGTIVVGYFHPSGTIEAEAFRWTAETGFVGLGDLGGRYPYSVASAISADGAVLVGASLSPSSGIWEEAMRWTADSGMVGLGDLPGGLFHSGATAMSADGSVIVGHSSSFLSDFSTGEAFRWTASSGMVGLGILSRHNEDFSTARGVSADGTVVVGTTSTEAGHELFRWTDTDGMIALGDLPDAPFPSAWAVGVSADGSVIAGQSQLSQSRCFRWTSESGFIDLGTPSGLQDCRTLGMSPDGSVIVGGDYILSNFHPVIWVESGGMRRFEDAMNEAGLVHEIEGWDFEWVTAVAADNETLTGWGYNPAGQQEAFLVNLGPPSVVEVPALSPAGLPILISLLALAGLAALARGERDRCTDR